MRGGEGAVVSEGGGAVVSEGGGAVVSVTVAHLKRM